MQLNWVLWAGVSEKLWDGFLRPVSPAARAHVQSAKPCSRNACAVFKEPEWAGGEWAGGEWEGWEGRLEGKMARPQRGEG